MKASRLPIKIPQSFRSDNKISKKEREEKLGKFKFYIPREESLLRERYNSLQQLGYRLIEQSKYSSRDFNKGEHLIVFMEQGTKILELAGEVLNQFAFACGKIGLDFKIDEIYFNHHLDIPLRFCEYKRVRKVFKKREIVC